MSQWTLGLLLVTASTQMWLAKLLSCSVMSDSATPWTVCSPPHSSVYQILQEEYWSSQPFPSPGDLPKPGIKTVSCIFCIGRQILYRCITINNNITFITFPVKRFLLCPSSYKNPCCCIPDPKLSCTFSHVQLFVTPWTLDSFVRGIFQARILVWVVISFSRVFLVQESNPCLLCLLCSQVDSSPLDHRGSSSVQIYDSKNSFHY